nr:hypothetical protein [uncultured Allomuricauda sp.]
MKKEVKIFFVLLAFLSLVVVTVLRNSNFKDTQNTVKGFEKHEHVIGYINPDESRLNNGFHVCNESQIYQYYNPEKATYSQGKNGIRRFILDNYVNEDYSNSGYLTFRFVINCKGEAGRYIIHENNLDLIPKEFNPKLTEHLFNLTIQLKEWNPNFIRGEYRDSYMFLTYKIENGEITEILP